MEIFSSECEHHYLPINNICTEFGCENNQLCDICLNSHPKDHKYLISISAINNNTFEKIIEKNEENFKNLEFTFNDYYKEYIQKINLDFMNIQESIINCLEISKKKLIEKLENLNEIFSEQTSVWTKLKIEYSKFYLQCLDEDTKTIKSNKSSTCYFNDHLEKDNLTIDSLKELKLNNNDSNFGNSLERVTFRPGLYKKKEKSKRKYTDSFSLLLSTINSVVEKQIYYKNENGANVILQDFHKNLKDSIIEDFDSFKKDLLNLVEEKIKFTNTAIESPSTTNNLQSDSYISNNNMNKSPNSYPEKKLKYKSPNKTAVDSQQFNKKINFNNDLEESFNSYSSVNNNQSSSSKKIPNLEKSEASLIENKLCKNSSFKKLERSSLGSFMKNENPNLNINSKKAYKNRNSLNNSFSNFNLNQENFISIKNQLKITEPIFENKILDPNNLEIETPKDLFIEKKGSWYSLEFVKDYDYIVCGFSNGEILIFKETDSTPIKTFRPRFKKIRKLIYSSPNSSIFVSYDDGYIVVIYLPDFKIEHFKMSSAQIYSIEIMENSNILIYGGVEKKILFSHVTNLNKVFLFYDSKEGEIQSLLYNENKDCLVASFRKSCLIFFKYSKSEIMYKHNFEEKDSCGMVLKKYKENTILTCGFFLKIHLFKICDENKIEHVGEIKLKFLHLYDLDNLYENYFIATTYDEGKIVIVDIENKNVVKSFSGYKGNIQVKYLESKNCFYVTSYCENLKKVNFK
jgi:hypothetical protein